ncbi:hypothetical protein DMENIID0001_141900 [Sergentomyia squamirostris]
MVKKVVCSVIWLLGVLSQSFVHGNEGNCPFEYRRNGPSLVMNSPRSNVDGKPAILNGDFITVTCLDREGLLKHFPNDIYLDIKCVDGEFVEVKRGTRWPSSYYFDCIEPELSDREITDLPGCSPDNEALEFGYRLPDLNTSIIIGEVCYARKEQRTVFLHVNHKVKRVGINYFRTREEMDQRKKNVFLEDQIEYEGRKSLRMYLGSPDVPQFKIQSFLNNVFLQSPSDTRMPIWNYFVTDPNYGKKMWKILQNNVFVYVKDSGSSDLWMGTSGIQKLYDPNGNLFNVHMSLTDDYPLTEYVWAVVRQGDQYRGFLIRNMLETPIDHIRSIVKIHKTQQEIEDDMFYKRSQEFFSKCIVCAYNIYSCPIEALRKIIPEVAELCSPDEVCDTYQKGSFTTYL